jgi:S-adenosylhomocysteine hydrolase
VGGPTSDPAEHDAHLWEVVRSHPDLLLDNGGDLFARYVDEPWDELRGGTEETTSGRMRLEPLRDRIGLLGDRRRRLEAAGAIVLEGGHMVNLAGPRPLGNSVESMDLGFALQACCLEAVARGEVAAEACVVPVPRAIDEQVASSFVSVTA